MYGKSKYGRKYARKGRASKRLATLAKGKTTAVQALAKSVRTLQRVVRRGHQIQNYFAGESRVALSANVSIFNLCNYSGYSPIFGADADDDNNQMIQHKSFGLDTYFSLENSINNEEDTIGFTVFIVSLKDSIGSAFNPGTGGLSLTDGVHYAMVNGIAMINKKVFTIHHTRRFNLTNHGTALANPSAQTQFGTDRRIYFKVSPNKVIMNPSGDWKALSSAVDPSKQYYMLVFNDNSVADLESPVVSFTSVHTMKTMV